MSECVSTFFDNFGTFSGDTALVRLLGLRERLFGVFETSLILELLLSGVDSSAIDVCSVFPPKSYQKASCHWRLGSNVRYLFTVRRSVPSVRSFRSDGEGRDVLQGDCVHPRPY